MKIFTWFNQLRPTAELHIRLLHFRTVRGGFYLSMRQDYCTQKLFLTVVQKKDSKLTSGGISTVKIWLLCTTRTGNVRWLLLLFLFSSVDRSKWNETFAEGETSPTITTPKKRISPVLNHFLPCSSVHLVKMLTGLSVTESYVEITPPSLSGSSAETPGPSCSVSNEQKKAKSRQVSPSSKTKHHQLVDQRYCKQMNI